MLGNSREKTTQGKLVFDTGSGLTQVDVDLIEYLGYSARDALGIRSVKGATGDAVEGYIVRIASHVLFENELKDSCVLTYDFKEHGGINGLLGWDLIQRLHLELDGTAGLIKIF